MDNPALSRKSAKLPTLDLAIIRSLREVTAQTGDDYLFFEIIDEFISTTPLRLDAMKQSLSSIDLKAINFAAHSLKSSSGSLGAARFSALCEEIELLSSLHDVTAVKLLLEGLEKELSAFTLAVDQVLPPGARGVA